MTPLTMTQQCEKDFRRYSGVQNARHILDKVWAELDATRDLLRQTRNVVGEAHDGWKAAEDSAKPLASVLGDLEKRFLFESSADDGDGIVNCDICGETCWGTLDVYDVGDIEHRDTCPFFVLRKIDE